jgi:esterase/lipase superfamily enzyme
VGAALAVALDDALCSAQPDAPHVGSVRNRRGANVVCQTYQDQVDRSRGSHSFTPTCHGRCWQTEAANISPPSWFTRPGASVCGLLPLRFDVIVRGMEERNAIVSRRMFLGGLVPVASLLALGGCANVEAAGRNSDASALSLDPTLLIATSRKPANGGRAKPWFGPERASTMTLARAKLVPPDDGRFSLAGVGLVDWRLDTVVPVSVDIADLVTQGSGGDTLIYVHGFNQTFETAALDAARLSDAVKFRGRTMLFSWPSKAGLLDYAYDRESAMFSRDDFERVLSSIVQTPGAARVHIVAHSMGTMLTLEGLRQLYGRYGDTVTGRIGAVVFAAPDIDMDVFSSAISRIGPLAGKITVITSTNDRALALSGRIAGGMTRVGAAEKAAIGRLGVRVIDASDTGWGIINHDLFLSNADVQAVIRRSIDEATA